MKFLESFLIVILVFALIFSKTIQSKYMDLSESGKMVDLREDSISVNKSIASVENKELLEGSTPTFAPNEVIVRTRDKRGELLLGTFTHSGRATVIDEIKGLNLKKVRLTGISVTDFIELANINPGIDFAEPNYGYISATIPNDTYYSNQWNHSKISSPLGWGITTGNSDTIIAVIDTGVDYTHPDLADKVILGYDFYDDDNDPMDENGHGTYCAGIAAAVTNNNQGIAGMSWGSKILAVRVFKDTTIGYGWEIAEGMTYAVDNGADVISLSGGAPFGSDALLNAVNYAYTNGCVIAAAVGNTGGYGVYYPTGYDHVIGVAATTSSDERASFSTYGPTVDVAAPGSSIFSTHPGNMYIYGSGTSAATPHVAGLAALLISKDPSLTPDEVESKIEQTADDLGESGRDDYYGYGRINVATALGVMTSSQYVTSLYQRILEREPDTPGLTGWSNAINNGMSTGTVAGCFLNSTERCNNYISGLYQSILERSPELGEVSAWSKAMTNGRSDETVKAAFYGSDEYYMYHLSVSCVEEYVASLYQNILGRSPLDIEKQMWVNGINGGLSRTQVALAFINSHEYHTTFVGDLYLQILERDADEDGLNGWTNAMDGGITQRTITGYFYGSYEYYSTDRSTTLGDDSEGDALSREVAVWLVWWDQVNGYQCLQENKEKISSVKPFWYKIEGDGSIQKFPGAEDKEIIDFAHNNNIEIAPVICNEEDAASVETVISNETLMNQHIANILQLVQDNNYDGIEIDYESLSGYSVRPAFSNFISQLADQLHSINKILEVSVHAKTSDAGTWNGPAAQDWHFIGQKTDRIKIMTYDYHWSTSEAGDIAPLSWMEQVLVYGTKEIPLEKIYLGIHFYGYDWQGSQAEPLTYNDVLERIQMYNPEIETSSELEKYFNYTKDDNLHQVYFADHETITQRLQLVNKYNVAGVGIWRIGQEDPENWQVIGEVF